MKILEHIIHEFLNKELSLDRMVEENQEEGMELQIAITPEMLQTLIIDCMAYTQGRLEQEVAIEEALKSNSTLH